MENKIFAKGLIFKRPHENAPDFIKGKLSINVAEFMQFMNDNQVKGWLNIQLKEGRAEQGQLGKYYAELDTWQPNKEQVPQDTQQASQAQPQEEIKTENIPF